MGDKIVCLVGESGSGKTTLCKELEKEEYNIIKSFTTREPRYEGEYGHIFIDKEDAKKIYSRDVHINNVIAYTYFDNDHYWATKEQYQDKGVSVYVIDVAGIKSLKENIKDAEIIVVYLKADRKVRMKRMLAERDPKSVIERIKHDDKVFKVIECDYVVDGNREVNEALQDIKQIVGGK